MGYPNWTSRGAEANGIRVRLVALQKGVQLATPEGVEPPTLSSED